MAQSLRAFVVKTSAVLKKVDRYDSARRIPSTPAHTITATRNSNSSNRIRLARFKMGDGDETTWSSIATPICPPRSGHVLPVDSVEEPTVAAMSLKLKICRTPRRVPGDFGAGATVKDPLAKRQLLPTLAGRRSQAVEEPTVAGRSVAGIDAALWPSRKICLIKVYEPTGRTRTQSP